MGKKIIIIDDRAQGEIAEFPLSVRKKLNGLTDVLASEGKLTEPDAKKIDRYLFEIRIRQSGQWRILYAYWVYNKVVILSGFRKKTQKTLDSEIKKGRVRLRRYI